MVRGTLAAAEALREARSALAGAASGEAVEAKSATQLERDSKGATVAAVATVAVGAAVLRFGGRAALVQLLGLDFVDDVGLRMQMDAFLSFFNSLGATRYLFFLGGWVVAKTLLVDFLGVALALASGVVFGGVLQGALTSALAATLASAIGFQLARTLLRDAVNTQVERRPALRAVERAVSSEGLKTVITLRLAPILPIPVGAYNYIYGATSLPFWEFMAGTFLGSIKPYLLDSYLGVFGKSIVDGGAGAGGDAALLATFGLVVLVGTFASQLAGRAWDELKAEMADMQEAAEASGASPAASSSAAVVSPNPAFSLSTKPPKVEGDGSEQAGWDWMGLFAIEPEDMPEWLRDVQESDRAARAKVWSVVEEEWAALRAHARAAHASATHASSRAVTSPLARQWARTKKAANEAAMMAAGGGGGGRGGERGGGGGGRAVAAAPGPPVVTEDGRFDVGTYFAESTVFTFVLIEALARYSDPALGGGGP